jgi:hypothetical protein
MKERGLIAPHVAIELVKLLLYIWEVRGSNIWWLSSVYPGKFEGVTNYFNTASFHILYDSLLLLILSRYPP